MFQLRNRRRDTIAAVILLCVGGAALVTGICAERLGRLSFGDQKEPRILTLPGTIPLTDEQILSFGRQVLVLDGRPVDRLSFPATPPELRRPEIWTDHGDGSGTLELMDRDTMWRWYVVLRREPDLVVGFSYHGN